MKKYSFRLQPVLDIREKTLEDKRLEMAQVIQLLNEQQEGLERLIAKQASYKDELESLSLEDDLNVFALANFKNYMVNLQEQITQQEHNIENTKKALRVKQEAVNEALKDVKVLEKLKEKQSQKFYKDIEMKEANEIDDISTARYRLKRA
ncbi:MAG: flagellar export protein FliJ [Candidatus Melainabacteria bacterium]|nr:MAG: flagellar export protein FliJ [Candidatus Melainabacteria bacterium]